MARSVVLPFITQSCPFLPVLGVSFLLKSFSCFALLKVAFCHLTSLLLAHPKTCSRLLWFCPVTSLVLLPVLEASCLLLHHFKFYSSSLWCSLFSLNHHFYHLPQGGQGVRQCLINIKVGRLRSVFFHISCDLGYVENCLNVSLCHKCISCDFNEDSAAKHHFLF